MSGKDVLNTIKEKGIKFVDFRFTDTRGKEQHVTVPSHTVEEELFTDGKMFDGSSIAGWKGINESDMIPDAGRGFRVHRSVFEAPTPGAHLRSHRTGDDAGLFPRSALRRAPRRGLSEVHGIADTAFFGPENESSSSIRDLERRHVRLLGQDRIRGSGLGIPARNTRAATPDIVRASRAAISPSRRSIPCRTSAPPCAKRWKKSASKPKCITTKSPLPASAKSASSSAP